MWIFTTVHETLYSCDLTVLRWFPFKYSCAFLNQLAGAVLMYWVDLKGVNTYALIESMMQFPHLQYMIFNSYDWLIGVLL